MNGILVSLVLLSAIRMVCRILKRALYAVNLVSNLLRPPDQFGGIGRHCREMAIEALKKSIFPAGRRRFLRMMSLMA